MKESLLCIASPVYRLLLRRKVSFKAMNESNKKKEVRSEVSSIGELATIGLASWTKTCKPTKKVDKNKKMKLDFLPAESFDTLESFTGRCLSTIEFGNSMQSLWT